MIFGTLLFIPCWCNFIFVKFSFCFRHSTKGLSPIFASNSKQNATSECNGLKSNFKEINFFSDLKTREVPESFNILYKRLIYIFYGQKAAEKP